MSESQLPNVCSAWWQEQIQCEGIFKSVSMKEVKEYHGWNIGSNFSILQHWIWKKIMVSFDSGFSILWVGRRNERAISSTGWTMQLWWIWGGGHSAVLMANENCQMKNEFKYTKRLGLHLWSRERLLHLIMTGIRLDSDTLLWSLYESTGSLKEV